MKRLIYFTFAAFTLFITFAMSMVLLHSCKDDKPEPTIIVPDTTEQAQQCANALLEYIQPDTYAWSYDLMHGELNLTADFICKIEIYYAKDSVVYHAEYICYIRNNDVDFEEFLEETIIY